MTDEERLIWAEVKLRNLKANPKCPLLSFSAGDETILLGVLAQFVQLADDYTELLEISVRQAAELEGK